MRPSYVENFLILNAAGGECLDDFGPLRQDGVRELIGHDLPSPEAARTFLYRFHDDKLIEQAQQRLLPGQISYIPEETRRWYGPGPVKRSLLHCKRTANPGGLVSARRPTSRCEIGHFGERPPIQSGQHGGEVFFRRTPNLRQDSTAERMAATLGPDWGLPTCSQFLRPKAMGRMEFSARLLDNSTSA